MKKAKRVFKRVGQFFAYIVRCKDGSFYTGSTNNLKNRLKLHNNGNGSKYVRSKRPVKLIYAKQFKYYKLALNLERKIKTFTRKEKEKLIKQMKKTKIKFQ